MKFFEIINFRLNHQLRIQCDNRQTIRILIFDNFIIKFRHVDIHRHWLRQKTMNEQIDLTWIFITIIIIDELTKILFTQKHETFMKLLKMKKTIENEISKEKKWKNIKFFLLIDNIKIILSKRMCRMNDEWINFNFECLSAWNLRRLHFILRRFLYIAVLLLR